MLGGYIMWWTSCTTVLRIHARWLYYVLNIMYKVLRIHARWLYYVMNIMYNSIENSCWVAILCDEHHVQQHWEFMLGGYISFDKLTSLFSLYPKGHRPMRKIHVEISLYTLSLKKKLHTCIIPCNTTLVWHIDKISTKYTNIIMDTFIILLF